MKKISGYIDVYDMLNIEKFSDNFAPVKDILKYIIQNNPTAVVVKVLNNCQFVFRFTSRFKEYFFKFDSRVNPYNELVVEEIAHDLNIPTISYDLAKLGPYEGVISLNYKNKKAKYISGNEILSAVYSSNKKDEHNNLMDIWNALEIFYKGNPRVSIIVKNLMQTIVNMLILDILTGQADRHSQNWEIC